MDRTFGHLLRVTNVVASLGILGIMLLICLDVIFRVFVNAPITGVPEIVKVGVVAIVWLQFGYALRAGQHLRSNLLFSALPRGLRRIVYGLNCLLGIGVFALIVLYTYDDVLKAFQRGTFEGEHPMRIPVWPVWAILVFGAGLMAVEYAIQLVRVVVNTETDVVDEGLPHEEAA
ncbi:TRAP transporter small permease [Roseovarius sp.]|uniref:TRAP transporter small permease n=1 Tax=Roseovarius sp. TaxID=1486281 RepID=UPI003563099B